MAQLFKTTSYIHIGGDEVPTEQWQRSKAAREVAEKAGRDVKQLEGLMLEKAAQHLQGLCPGAIGEVNMITVLRYMRYMYIMYMRYIEI